ncbi:hypothetical protein ACQ7HM_10475 [Williamsia sp. MIQD14]|uniref:hypothetical protein n=1 Tax=Williamsia sp. MIQD14 TaxID=3425703 RepID=UPI003DA1238B
MAERKVYEGTVVPPAMKAVSALDGFNALKQVVDAAQECVTIHATESTKQEQIRASRDTEIARIKAGENVLRNYFALVFADRKNTIDQMFTRLDTALESGDPAVIKTVVDSVVDIAKSSPIADMGDLSQVRAALDDPDHVWEL